MKAMQVVMLLVCAIFPDPTQPRRKFDDEAEAGLAQSMREVGQLQPVRVWKEGDKYFLEEGERRWRAAKRLKWEQLAAIVVGEGKPDPDKTLRQLVANCQREDLTDFERMETVTKIMRESGWNGEETARHTGMSAPSISRFSVVANGPEEVREAMKEELIRITLAYELAKMTDAAKRLELLTLAAGGKLTRDAIRGKLRRKPERNGRKVARVNCPVAGGVVTVAGGEVTIDSLISLLEDVLGKARKARTQGMEAGTFSKMLRDQLKGGQS